MGIQDRDYYWKDRDIDGAKLPPSGQRFRVIDEVRHRPSEPAESHSPERVLGVLTAISALIVVAFISYQSRIDRAEKQAQQVAAQQATQASIARAAEANSRAAAQAEQQARLHADQLEQKKKLEEKIRQEAERKNKRLEAWNQFYKPSLQCQADWTVECANALIRARARFDDQYKN